MANESEAISPLHFPKLEVLLTKDFSTMTQHATWTTIYTWVNYNITKLSQQNTFVIKSNFSWKKFSRMLPAAQSLREKWFHQIRKVRVCRESIGGGSGGGAPGARAPPVNLKH